MSKHFQFPHSQDLRREVGAAEPAHSGSAEGSASPVFDPFRVYSHSRSPFSSRTYRNHTSKDQLSVSSAVSPSSPLKHTTTRQIFPRRSPFRLAEENRISLFAGEKKFGGLTTDFMRKMKQRTDYTKKKTSRYFAKHLNTIFNS